MNTIHITQRCGLVLPPDATCVLDEAGTLAHIALPDGVRVHVALTLTCEQPLPEGFRVIDQTTVYTRP